MTFGDGGLVRTGLGPDGLWDPPPSLLNFIHTLNLAEKAQTQVPSQ